MRARAEAVRVREIEELAEARGRAHALRAVRRKLDFAACGGDLDAALAQADQFELCDERLRALVEQMNIEPVEALVGHQHLNGLQRFREAVQGAFRPSCGIDQAPACAGSQILKLPDQRTATCRTAAAPFSEYVAHQFGDHRARQVQITLRVFVTQARGLDTIQRLQIVVAHVVEIPAGAGVARHGGLPARIVQMNRAERVVQGGVVGHVGEGEAFGGEAHLRAAHVVERTLIGADAIVVSDALVSRKRPHASRWRVAHVRHVAAFARDDGG